MEKIILRIGKREKNSSLPSPYNAHTRSFPGFGIFFPLWIWFGEEGIFSCARKKVIRGLLTNGNFPLFLSKKFPTSFGNLDHGLSVTLECPISTEVGC